MADVPTQGTKIAAGNGYGERKAMEELQGGAAMAGTPAPPSPPPLSIGDLRGGMPLDGPTQSPDEPVTAGVDAGAGPSASEVGIFDDSQVTDEMLRPQLRSWQLLANLPGSNTETRTIVRQLKARLSRG